MPFPKLNIRPPALFVASILVFLAISGCQNTQVAQTVRPTARPTVLSSVAITRAPAATHVPTAAPPATNTAIRINPTSTAAPTPPRTVQTLAQQPAGCGRSPVTQQIIDSASTESWMAWVRQLSGAEPATIGGKPVMITTRLSSALFNGQPNGPAFDFVLEQVRGWYPDSQIQVIPYTVISRNQDARYTWKNLVLTLPGTRSPDEIVILSAHLDSNAHENPEQVAPGAEDNASGSATLLEAARILRGYPFERTIQIIWFTGEEQGLLGSKAYVEQIKDPKAIRGVVNLDMFGYDSDGDRCFELHVGSLPQSDAVGQCFVQSMEAYGLGLHHYDYITDGAVHGSDHSSFWTRSIGAVEILENMFDNHLVEAGQPNACAGADPDPNYHSAADTAEKINVETAIRTARAALATIAGLAGPIQTSK